MRRGCWDPDARVADMDLDGVQASLCLPVADRRVRGHGVLAGDGPRARPRVRARVERLAPRGVGRRRIPSASSRSSSRGCATRNLAADEVRRNAERGFKAVSFLENPVDLGLPSMHTDHWDPFLAACEETDTVVCLHCASSRLVGVAIARRAARAAHDAVPGQRAGHGGRLVVVGRAGPLPSVAHLPRRERHRLGADADQPHRLRDGPLGIGPRVHGRAPCIRPMCCGATSGSAVIDLTSTLQLRHEIGVDHIVLESDYPHADSTWPETSRRAEKRSRDLPADEVERICWRNASELFRHPGPPTSRGHDQQGSRVMLDLLIRGGTVVDGTGSPGRVADVGCPRRSDRRRSEQVDDRRDANDRRDGTGRRPGLRRPAHALRRPALLGPDREPVAAARRHDGVRRQLRIRVGAGRAANTPTTSSRLMSRVEGIPLAALEAGLDWEWSSFADWLGGSRARASPSTPASWPATRRYVGW